MNKKVISTETLTMLVPDIRVGDQVSLEFSRSEDINLARFCSLSDPNHLVVTDVLFEEHSIKLKNYEYLVPMDFIVNTAR